MFKIRLAKENFKFSASHFTIFSETEAERLHGHNYYVTMTLVFDDWVEKTSMTADFSRIKEPVRVLCENLDEKILIAEKSEHLKTKKEDEGIWVFFDKKKYFFPLSETLLLPLTNITCEALAFYLSTHLKGQFASLPQIRFFETEVTETRGQSASYRFSFSGDSL